MTLAANEKILIQRLLALVNLKKISNARQVEKLAENVAGFTRDVQSYGGDVNQPRQLQATLKTALDDVVSSKRGAPSVAIKIANGQLQHVQARFQLTSDGDLLLLSGVIGCDAVFGYALALLVDRKRGMRKRLVKCGAPDCGSFVLPFGRGRPQLFCSESHRRAADKLGSKKRSQTKRDKTKATQLLRQGKSIDFVCGAIQRLDKKEIQRIAAWLK